MTYKEFSKWCNERACDGCWGMIEAIICIRIINSVEEDCKGILTTKRKEKMFHELYEKQASVIVNATNERIEELLKGE